MKLIPNYPGYSITKAGRVWSHKTKKWLKMGNDGRGYLQVSLCKNSKKFTRKIHRLILETYIGPRPKGMEGRHLNGDRQANWLSNLKWGTKSENMQDAIKHGTFPKTELGKCGEKHNQSKLSDRDRRLIIYQYLTGLFTARALSNIYKVSETTIGRLVAGKRWPFVNAIEIMRATV